MTASLPQSLPSRAALAMEAVRARTGRRTRLLGLVVVGAVVAFFLSGFIYQVLYAEKAFPGIAALDLPADSLSRSDLRSTLGSRGRALEESTLTLNGPDRSYSRKVAQLGIFLNSDATATRMMDVGRSGSLFDQFGDRWGALFSGIHVPAVFSVDQNTLREFIGQASRDINRPAVDASLVVGATAVQVKPAVPGQSVNVEATVQSVLAALDLGLPSPVPPLVEVIPPAIVANDLREASSAAQIIVSGPLQLRIGAKSWSIPPAELAPMVAVQRVAPSTTGAIDKDSSPRYVAALDEQLLRARLAAVARDVDVAPHSASPTVISGGQLIIAPSGEGLALDIDSAVADIQKVVVQPLSRTVELTTRTIQADILTQQVAQVLPQVVKLSSAPVVLAYQEYSWTLNAATLATMAKVKLDASGKVVPYLDDALLRNFVAGIEARVNRPPVDAKTEARNGVPRLVQESANGLTVDVQSTMAAVNAAAAGDSRLVPLIVGVQKPNVEVKMPDLLASASTSYAGSIWQRAHNVRLATSRLNGTMVPPGAEFSFNKSVGKVSVANGYEMGYGIAWADGQMQTLPSEGGGICQVASTLFHAIFWSGLQVTDRSPHMYWISRYGQPPMGLTGLDATVDDGYGIDLKFTNNTGNWLFIKSSSDDVSIFFSIYGTKPDWQIKVDKPVLSNWTAADYTIVYEEHKSIAPGNAVWVEHAEGGFDAVIVRTVLDRDGKLVDKLQISSHYRPSRNVILVPSGTLTPTPGPGTPGPGTPGPSGTPGSGTPVPSGTPGAQPSPTSSPKPN